MRRFPAIGKVTMIVNPLASGMLVCRECLSACQELLNHIATEVVTSAAFESEVLSTYVAPNNMVDIGVCKKYFASAIDMYMEV